MREYKEMYKYEQYTGTHEFTKGKLERHTGGPGRIELWAVCWRFMLQLRHSDQQLGEIHTLQAPKPGHEDPGESDETPQASGDTKARWRAEISICVSIKLNHNHTLKTVS